MIRMSDHSADQRMRHEVEAELDWEPSIGRAVRTAMAGEPHFVGGYRRLSHAALMELGERLPGRSLQVASHLRRFDMPAEHPRGRAGGTLDVIEVLPWSPIIKAAVSSQNRFMRGPLDETGSRRPPTGSGSDARVRCRARTFRRGRAGGTLDVIDVLPWSPIIKAAGVKPE